MGTGRQHQLLCTEPQPYEELARFTTDFAAHARGTEGPKAVLENGGRMKLQELLFPHVFSGCVG